METKNNNTSDGSIGKAMAGKTARPCDVCGRERARWYCAADEAFLCEHCDGSVHSANSVARRHDRIRLGSTNSAPKMENRRNSHNSPFMATRKRTRSSRPHPKPKHEFRTPALVEVPVNSPSEEFKDDDDDLLHQVPIFMPLAEEFCASKLPEIDRATPCSTHEDSSRNLPAPDCSIDLNHFLRSEADLCEFAVDMEMDMKSIIGHGSDEPLGVLGSLYATEKYHHQHHHTEDDDDNNTNSNSTVTEDGEKAMGRGGLASDSANCDCTEEGEGSLGWAWGRIKEEDDDDKIAQLSSDPCRKAEPSDAKVKVEDPDEAWDTIELNIDYNEFAEEEEEELDDYREPDPDMKFRADGVVQEDLKINLALDSIFGPCAPTDLKLISLRLNYEDVLTAWSDRGSPWACATTLETASDDCSSDGAGLVPDLNMPNAHAREESGQVPLTNNGGGHGGRQARVLRYREKRRTRLFSKKIRYEVRKLNAEKRPRMKGRFVKRTSSMCSD